MKYTPDQMILAAHVRAVALDFLRGERNALSEKWHAQNPGERREMEEFAVELTESKPFNEFILQAAKELENITTIMLKPSPETAGQS